MSHTERISNTHILFSALPPSHRAEAHRLAVALQVPCNPTALTRLLTRAANGLANYSLDDVEGVTQIGHAVRVLRHWQTYAKTANGLSEFYLAPLDRDRAAANPALGSKSTHPLYAALVMPPLSAAEEILYSRIVGAAVALAVRHGAQDLDDQHRASMLAEEARQRAEGVFPVLQNIGNRLPAAMPHESAVNLAHNYLRVRGIASSSSLAASERSLLRHWLRALDSIGGSATGKGLLKRVGPDPGQSQIAVEVDDDDDKTASILCPRAERNVDSDRDAEPEVDPVAIGPDTPPDVAPPQNEEAQLQSQRAWTVATRTGAMLPLSWNAFTAHELDVLHEHLTDLPNDIGAAIIRSGLACGLRPRAIADALDSGQCPDGFQLKDSASHHIVERALAATQLKRQIRPTGDNRFLAADGQVTISGPPILRPTGTYSAALDQTLVAIRKDHRLRLSDGRVARTLVMDFIKARPDTYVADIALNASTLQGLSGAPYYSSVRADQLARSIEHTKHRTRAQIQSSGNLIGSHGIPTVKTLQSSIQSLSQLVENGRTSLNSPPDLARFHNCFVGLELLLLMFASGHRLVTDPFPHEDCLLDSGHFVVADKISTPSHATRLTVASELAKKQWESHRSHLRELSYRMANFDAPDADQVQGVVDGITPVSAPFFFFLTDDLRVETVTPKSFRSHLGSSWELPDSAHRQYMSYALREAGCSPELIHAHLGHWLRGDAPFGPTSLLRPSQLVSALSDPIDRTLSSIGLIPRSGLPVAGVYRRHAADTYAPVPCSPLGPIRRSNARTPASTQDTFVDEIFAATCWNHGVDITSSNPSAIPRGAVTSARDVISQQFGNESDGLKRALHRLRRICLGLRSKGWGIWIPGSPYSPADSRPVLADFSGRSARIAKEIQVAFHNWLASTVDNLHPTQLHATALLSSVLRGGLLLECNWSRFLRALRDGSWRVESVDWLELGESQKSGHRYLGDAVTRALVRRASMVDPQRSPAELIVVANRLLRSFCRDIKRPDPVKGVHGASLRIDSLTQILPCLTDRYATQVSGMTLAHMRGDVCSYSTTPQHLVRQLTGKRFETSAAYAAPEPDRTFFERPARGITTVEKINPWVKEFLGILQDSQTLSSISHNSRQQARRRHKRRTELLMQLTAFRSRLTQGTCPASLLRLVEYAIHLTEHGGLQQEKLAPSTIQDYAGLNVREFIRCLGSNDPAELDGDERTLIYQRLLKQSDSPTSWAKRLRYFDLYLQAEYDADPADWRSIAPDLPTSESGVYDYLTVADINRLDIIATSLDGGDQLSTAAAASVRLLSRTGIRSGETYRLTSTDLAPAPLAYIRVENKASGEVKTRSGIRHAAVMSLPSLGELDPPLILQSLFNSIDSHSDRPLFAGTDASPRVSRSRLLHRMQACICAATGHSRSRPHHCRHSIASHGALLAMGMPHPLTQKIFGGISADEYERAHATLQLQLTGRSDTTMLWRIALPQTVGHREFATTIEHYIHLADVILAVEVDEISGNVPPALAASLLDISPNAYYQARDRAKRNNASADFHELLLERRSSTAAPKGEEFPKLTDVAPEVSFGVSQSLADASLVHLAAMVGAVYGGAAQADLVRCYSATESQAKALLDSVQDMQLFLGGKVRALQGQRAETPALLSADLGRACHLLKKPGASESWNSTECRKHAGRLLACWRPSHRHFDCPNELAQTAVQTWLRFAGLQPLESHKGDSAILSFRGSSTADGLVLSALVLVAYFVELQSRLRERLAS